MRNVVTIPHNSIAVPTKLLYPFLFPYSSRSFDFVHAACTPFEKGYGSCVCFDRFIGQCDGFVRSVALLLLFSTVLAARGRPYTPAPAAALMRIMREDIISMERKFIRDHAKRSRENYELLKSSGSPTAALIDSLIGLLMLPSQKLFDEIAQDIVDDASLLENILSECSTGPTTRSPRNLFQVAQHLRSSAAHKAITVSAEILPEPGRPVSVDWLTFKDQNNRESTTVEITMSVETLEQFFYAFSDAAASL